jgi:hypothetical protein
MLPVLMQKENDCEVAALATACAVTYDQAKKALGWQDLPGGAENPIFGNPWNLYWALLNLGFWKKNVTLTQLLKGEAEPGKTVVLVHFPEQPTLKQHWVGWGGRKIDGAHTLYWGKSELPVHVKDNVLKDLFKRGWPNCAFSVYKASAWRILWEKLKGWIL